uniref:NAD(+) kinase n=1 Tax=Lates calcarifer TaxID=8187 RepID=A0A4W6BRJ6_LATCA
MEILINAALKNSKQQEVNSQSQTDKRIFWSSDEMQWKSCCSPRRPSSYAPQLGITDQKSLHGPSPVTTFGPKACMLQNPHAVMHIQDPASQRLTWNKPPKSVLVIKKIRDASLLQPFKELCVFLTEVKNMIVYVEKKVLEDPAISGDENFGAITKKFCTFREDLDDISNRVDFIICLGGDGTLLYASSLFQESVPPVMAFHLGSLGFLTPFKFDTYQSQVTQIIEGNAAIVLRSRLKVRVLKENWEKKARVDEKGIILTNGDVESSSKAMQYQVLNEVVVDRGPSSYLSNVDLFLDGHLITTVQGDGVIVSTPTGSTAYAVAAGASMIHPNVPAIMITPICPHSLSFRPIVVPAGVELKIMLSRDARNTAWVSFDGRKRQEICHGDSITITTSCFPVPSICFRDPVNDWFESLAQCLHWNVRKKQNYLSSEDEEF